MKTTPRYTPVSSYEDFTALRSLPQVRVELSAKIEQRAEGLVVRVHLRNPGDHLAFQIRLAIREKNAETEILPVLWDANYIELMPHESRDIAARFLTSEALDRGATFAVSGWNIEPETLPLESGGRASVLPTKDAGGRGVFPILALPPVGTTLRF